MVTNIVTAALASNSDYTWDFEEDSFEFWLSEVFKEHGPIENTQFTLWIISAIVGGLIAWDRRAIRERVFGAWLAMMCVLAALRELDSHIFLNPEFLGSWGVRYRLDWWISLDAPVLPRMFWAIVGVLFLCAVIVPFLRIAPKHVLLLKSRDRAWWMFLISGVALGLGWLFDDVLGRNLFMHPVYTQALEETAELVGAAAFFVAVLSMRKLSLTTRENMAKQRSGEPPDD